MSQANSNYEIRLFAEFPNTDGILKEFSKHILLNHFNSVQQYKKDNKIMMMHNLLSNLFAACARSFPLIISQRTESYSFPKIYGMNHVSYNSMRLCISLLEKNGFISLKKGFYDRSKNTGHRTRISVQGKLIHTLADFVTKVGYQPDTEDLLSQLEYYRIDYATPILLKDKSKRLVNYDITESKVACMIHQVDDYNKYMTGKVVAYSPLTSILPLYNTGKYCNEQLEIKTALYRVFNNESFENGGRYFGAEYQQIASIARQALVIDNSPTIEIDYSGLHPRMLYHMLNLEFAVDPYSIIKGNIIIRKAAKLMFNIAINARTQLSAIKAFNFTLHTMVKSEKLEMINELNEFDLPAKKIIEKLLLLHPSLKPYLFSGIGSKLQNIESMIASQIIDEFISSDKPILCIHDSFVVHKQDSQMLEDLMQSYYQKEMNGFSAKIKYVNSSINFSNVAA